MSGRMMTVPRWAQALAWVGAASLLGCAAPAPAPVAKPKTVVVLLPQSDAQGKPIATAVEVKSGSEAVTLAQPFALTESTPDGKWRQRLSTVNEVQARYGELLRVQPPSPERFVLNFVTGKSQLTPESEKLLPELIRQAQARAGGEIVVTGHTDRVGKAEANDALSLQRANAISEMLKAQGFSGALISTIGRGEREPLVPTDDEVAEPRNRRAEVVIR